MSVDPSTSNIQHEMEDANFGKRKASSPDEGSENPASIANTTGTGMCILALHVVLD